MPIRVDIFEDTLSPNGHLQRLERKYYGPLESETQLKEVYFPLEYIPPNTPPPLGVPAGQFSDPFMPDTVSNLLGYPPPNPARRLTAGIFLDVSIHINNYKFPTGKPKRAEGMNFEGRRQGPYTLTHQVVPFVYARLDEVEAHLRYRGESSIPVVVLDPKDVHRRRYAEITIELPVTP